MIKIRLFFSLLIMINIACYGQDDIKVNHYRTIETSIFLNDGTSEWHTTDFIVTITTKNLKIHKVKIYSRQEEQYDIIGLKSTYVDSMKIPWGVYDCINSQGERYTLEHGIFNNYVSGHIYTLMFTSKSGNGMVYRLKLN